MQRPSPAPRPRETNADAAPSWQRQPRAHAPPPQRAPRRPRVRVRAAAGAAAGAAGGPIALKEWCACRRRKGGAVQEQLARHLLLAARSPRARRASTPRPPASPAPAPPRAPTCAALGAGEQTILLRKGGIKEPRFVPEAKVGRGARSLTPRRPAAAPRALAAAPAASIEPLPLTRPSSSNALPHNPRRAPAPRPSSCSPPASTQSSSC
jgi:hypothetical protein